LNDLQNALKKKGLICSLTRGIQQIGSTTSFISPNGNITIKANNLTGIAPKIIAKNKQLNVLR